MLVFVFSQKKHPGFHTVKKLSFCWQKNKKARLEDKYQPPPPPPENQMPSFFEGEGRYSNGKGGGGKR